ncbi:MAG: VanW family protein [Clostridia bacterium]|nr:VanW family protein [Clostridia bacterium]
MPVPPLRRQGTASTPPKDAGGAGGAAGAEGAAEVRDVECDAAGPPQFRLYGRVRAAELPWAADEPARLREARSRLADAQLVMAFRTTLPTPILDERYNIARAADLLAGSVVAPGAIFSQNGTIGPYTRARGYRYGPAYAGTRIVPSEGGGVCKIASTLYNVVVLSDLEVVERHPHSMLVPYVPPGRDATVAYGHKDFRFRNTSRSPILIWADAVGDTLYVAFYGAYVAPEVQWHHEVLAHQKTWMVRRFNPSLPPGTQRVVVEGADGVTVRTWVTVRRGDRVERRDFGVDRYQPMPRVVEVGPGG